MVSKGDIPFLFCILVLIVGFSVLLPSDAGADGKIAVFFHGWCHNPKMEAPGRDQASACNAGNIFASGLSGVEVHRPALNEGCYGGGTPLSETRGKIKGKDVTLIAFSGGSCGMQALVDAVNSSNKDDLKRIKTLVSLDATSAWFNPAVKTVQSVNPSVQVIRYSSKSLGVSHDRMAGSPKMLADMAKLMDGKSVSATYDGQVPPNPYYKSPSGKGDTLLASLFAAPKTNTGLFGPPSSGLSSFASLFSAFAPQQAALTSPYTPTPLPPGLSAFNSSGIPLQAPPPVNLMSSISAANSVGLTNQPGTTNSQTQSQTVSNANSQQNNSSTFTSGDVVKVSYSSSTPSQPTLAPAASSDLRTTLTNILLKTRDILQSLVQLLRR